MKIIQRVLKQFILKLLFQRSNKNYYKYDNNNDRKVRFSEILCLRYFNSILPIIIYYFILIGNLRCVIQFICHSNFLIM